MSKRTSFKKIGKGLAGAVAIASGTSAYGSIVTVNPPPDSITTPGVDLLPFAWDVNNDGASDFLFRNRFPNTLPGDLGVVWQENMSPFTGTAATNGLISYDGAFIRYAFALAPGFLIGPANTDFSTSAQVTLGSRYSYGSAGIFNYGGFAAGPNANGAVAPGTFAFAGFRFTATDGTHFGWIKLAVTDGVIDFVNAAYESTPDTAIMAGDIGAIPEPGTMALLALGAAGILGTTIKRRRA
jgi:hypothetical protein